MTWASAAWLALAAGGCTPNPDLSTGVSWELAQHRVNTMSDVSYDLFMSIPDSLDQRIRAYETVRFTLSDATTPVVLDFRSSASDVYAVRIAGADVRYKFINEHIVVPQTVLHEGENAIDIEFLAGDLSLNRNATFLYTLFVPDRASTAFPAFDQPNLKAVFRLTLETPITWKAVANSPLAESHTVGHRMTQAFAATRPISTYLFSFAAGEFEVETAQRAGRTMHMYHRETDTLKVARNRDAIFDLHATALEWLEDYTGIPYPFDKFDFVLIPSFQYGGMEHPGAILYRASSLMLEESATQNQLLGRASVIAHETTHMWFGDLVTMNWFDDVWMKEVFANFMAAKIVNPSFPNIDHRLRFFLSHFPAAYDVDRTAGTNPIRQQLENLKEAGTLYGAIIYEKAPIVMQHLERLIGDEPLRQGLQEYLETFKYGNATWPQLIDILDRRSDEDLQAWSRVWVQESGRPTVEADVSVAPNDKVDSIRLIQRDPAGRGRVWNQLLQITLGWSDSQAVRAVHLSGASAAVENVAGLPAPRFVLTGGDGTGYGRFPLDAASTSYLLQRLPDIEDAMTRASAWVTLWDAMLEGSVPPGQILDLARRALPLESDELITQRILGYLRSAYWRFSTAADRRTLAPQVEALLWQLMSKAPKVSLKSAYFRAFVDVALTDSAVARVERVWRSQTAVPGLPLSESDYTSIAEQLALRGVADAPAILAEQRERIANPDRRARFEFVLPALSADAATRDSFFDSLREARNREHEPWVLAGLSLLHHPLRAATSVKYIRPSLDLLEEIQATGDIFFPARWMDATLGGHNSREAAEIVAEFLDAHPDYPRRLREKIEQSADPLNRAARITGS